MENEEQFILERVQASRHALKIAIDDFRNLTIDFNSKKFALEKEAEEAEQALLDLYQSQGKIKSRCGDFAVSIKTTTSIDIADIDAVPEEFLRITTKKEPNKLLIKEAAPIANWYSKKVNNSIVIRRV